MMRLNDRDKLDKEAGKRDIAYADVPELRVKGRAKNRPLIILSVLIVLLLLILLMAVRTVGSLGYVRKQTDQGEGVQERSYKQYKRHYALITESFDDNFWQEVYEGARQYGEKGEVYLEWTGQELAVKYTKEELLKIAIASHVNGIILEGDGTDGIRKLIDQADAVGIPVITVLSDSLDSSRQSFVGIGRFNLGREYGRQIVRIATKDTKEVLVLMDTESTDSGQNLIYNGIKETLANEGNHLELILKTLAVNGETAYGGEEAIREIFQKKAIKKGELPDIIICLNERNTISTYQAAIDYNLVGEIEILGYYVTDTILNAISRNVIAATIAVDSEQMGIDSVRALDEYIETGHVNDFVTMDVNAVTSNNVKEYMHNAEDQE